nr:uncharacterized protein LOC108945904 [Nicotiana tomentosiformis]
MERATPVRMPHTSIADLPTWSDVPLRQTTPPPLPPPLAMDLVPANNSHIFRRNVEKHGEEGKMAFITCQFKCNFDEQNVLDGAQSNPIVQVNLNIFPSFYFFLSLLNSLSILHIFVVPNIVKLPSLASEVTIV